MKTQLEQAKIFSAVSSFKKIFIKKYDQSEPKFNGVYSRNNSPEIKDRVYLINLDEFKSIGTHWIVLYVNGNNIIYFDSFGAEHVPKATKKFIVSKKIITNIGSKSLLDDTNLFSPNEYGNIDKIIVKYFQ